MVSPQTDDARDPYARRVVRRDDGEDPALASRLEALGGSRNAGPPLSPKEAGDRVTAALLDMELELIAVFGDHMMKIEDIVRLRPGSVLEVDRLVGETIDLYLEQRLVARGSVEVVDDRYTLRITETLLRSGPLKRTSPE